MKKLFIGNLPHSVDSDQLRDLFEEFNPSSANVIVDKFSDRSRGFGFVEVPDDQMEAAIEAMNGVEVEGRNITVNEARPREEGENRPRRSFGGGGGGGRGGDSRGGGGGYRGGGSGGGGGRGGDRGGDRGGSRGGGGGGRGGDRGGNSRY